MNNLGNTEVLQIIEAVSRERNIPRGNLIDAMEQAIQGAGRKKYGNEHNIKAEINENTGEITLYRILQVVEIVENTFTEIELADALSIKPDIKIGEEIKEALPPIDLGRVAAQTAKQVIVQKVGEAERLRQYEDYKDRKGDILNGTVKRIEFGNIIIDLGRAEALIRKDQQIKGEIFNVNDRIKAFVVDVSLEAKGHQIFLSRTSNNFLKKLFEMEVPEVYDNIIEIKAIAREPGSKAKVAVYAADVGIDPVGSCVGVKGSRIRAISNELNGEKIDVVLWDGNIAQFVINAMTPAQISKIVFDEETKRVEAVVPDDQLSLAIGRKGQNVRLASKITGWVIDVMTEEQESKRRTEEFTNTTKMLMSKLDLEEVLAQLLSAEGFITIDQIANTDQAILENLEGFDKALATELKNRAIEYIEKENEKIIEDLEKLGTEQDIIDALNLPPEYILKLAEYGVKNIEDLAEMSIQEFRNIVPKNTISDNDIETLINFAKSQNEQINE